MTGQHRLIWVLIVVLFSLMLGVGTETALADPTYVLPPVIPNPPPSGGGGVCANPILDLMELIQDLMNF